MPEKTAEVITPAEQEQEGEEEPVIEEKAEAKDASTWNEEGINQQAKGLYDKAIESFDKALAVALETLGDKDPLIATYLNNLGSTWNAMGEHFLRLTVIK